MKKFVLFLLLVLFLASVEGADIAPREILDQVDQVRSPGANFTFFVKVAQYGLSRVSESEFEVWVRERRKSLVLFREPTSQKGRALLLDGQNMWIYIPGTSRSLRISPQQQLSGTVSNADVARVVFSLDYSAERTHPDKLDGADVLKLELRSLEDNVPYRNINLWVSADGYRPLRADFFSLSGKLLRTVSYQGYQQILGKLRPTRLEITNALNPEEKTILTYSQFQVREMPKEYYQPSYLNRL
jgi:outer membrane lipoprotein-sorting protein